jgi:Spy/CpxP family protein refolding chaperone
MTHRLAGIGVLLVLSAGAQHKHSPPGAPGAAQASHHACLEQERAALERGEGFGMALAADRNGYPGPRHVLELKAELKLTPEQESAMEKLFAQMHQQAVARGREVLIAEARLEELFAAKRPAAELREQAYRVATLRAELRWVHLSAHLAARKLLTPEQLAAYQQIRPGARPAAVASPSR